MLINYQTDAPKNLLNLLKAFLYPFIVTSSTPVVFLQAFQEIYETAGGDDDMERYLGELTPLAILAMAPYITEQDIEAYKTCEEEEEYDLFLETYNRIRATILKHFTAILTKEEITHIIQFLDEVDENFDTFQEHMLNSYGDPGHDVGDAANALELFHNLVTQGHDPKEYKVYLMQSLQRSEIQTTWVDLGFILESLESIDDHTYTHIFTSLYF